MRFSINLFMLAIHGGQSLQYPEETIAYQTIEETNRFLSSVQWTNVGAQIVGTKKNTGLGHSSALNGEGNRLAVGGGPGGGVIRVFEYANNIWTQLGSDINGAAGDGFKFVAMNEIGDRFIGGGPAGNVARAYHYTGSRWKQMGPDFKGVFGDSFGASVAMNSEGNMVVIGATYTELDAPTEKYRGGRVLVYKWSEPAELWIKIGGYINCDYGDFLKGFNSWGNVVAMNNKGNIIAAAGNGFVEVYELTNDTWVKMGEKLMNGENIFHDFGHALALNSVGDILLIGAPEDVDEKGERGSGFAQVYKYTAINTQKWTKIGQDLEGDKNNEKYGKSVAINDAGDRVAVGAHSYNVGNGYLRVFDYTGSIWTQTGQDLVGKNFNDFYGGSSLGFNTIGDKIVVGAKGSDNNGITESGSVEVYEYKLPLTLAPTESTSIPSSMSSSQPTGKNEVLFNNQDFSINEPSITFKDESGKFIIEVTYTVGRTVDGLALTLYQAGCSTTAHVSDIISSNSVYEYKLPLTLAPTESTSIPSSISSSQPTGKSEVSFNNQDFSIKEPFVTFKDESGKLMIKVTYTVGRTVDGLALTLYQAGCSTAAHVEDIISSNSAYDDLKKSILVNQSQFADSPLMELSTRDNVGSSQGSLKFCVNAEVLSSGTSVSFRKTNINLDFDLTSNSFTVTSNDIEANEIQDTTTTVDVNYDINAFRCLPTSFEKIVAPGPLLQNEVVAICLEPNDDSKATVDISNFEMNFVQDGSGVKYAVAKYSTGGPEPSGSLSVISRSDQRWKVVARIVTVLFNSGLSFNVTGNAYLEFRGERRFLSSVNTKATRSVQSVAIDPAGVSSFGMEVKTSKNFEAKKNSNNKPVATLCIVNATLAIVIGFFLFKKLW
eukprot:CAMPEP_0194347534 /NCGR_PEP_ID=MMETSP0171-20130528/106042_1 /TAXON_ID=218684 /ORGANISM="Corethron pennatum, Strain L29A3" /LENGTH=884 /DNA_ID=CAMNT_0039114797 /DNA_START=78 /DNA_END=2732 /DNA_ORIENTATION=+